MSVFVVVRRVFSSNYYEKFHDVVGIFRDKPRAEACLEEKRSNYIPDSIRLDGYEWGETESPEFDYQLFEIPYGECCIYTLDYGAE